MQFPDSPATELTERIMAKVRAKMPEQSVPDYNRTYEAVYEVLTERDAAFVQTARSSNPINRFFKRPLKGT